MRSLADYRRAPNVNTVVNRPDYNRERVNLLPGVGPKLQSSFDFPE